MKRYFISDLAYENFGFEGIEKSRQREKYFGYFSEYERDGIRVCRAVVDDKTAKLYNCRKGTYITVFCEVISRLGEKEFNLLSDEISHLILECIEKKLSRRLNRDTRILVVGIGNPDMATDSIGPNTAQRIDVTGHIAKLNEDIEKYKENEVKNV